ncbi:factor-independent urate hydroxylase [Streptomyces sp. NPDC127051]|uniref:factor-independent urate hydroxylase n=1 Tax=Streptomyces sp. NPDC127051 TaxID=3347119 RepID=UPI0036520A85
MPITVESNNYGKSDVSFLLVNDSRAGSEVRDISAEVRFEGEFDSVFSRGDNSALLPTRSMVNTVYALAQQNMPDEIETFAVILAERFLLACPAAMVVQIKLTETPWTRLAGKNGPSPHCFAAAGSERYTATVHAVRGLEPSITSGLTGLRLLMASGASFTGFIRDEYTTMPEVNNRPMSLSLNLDWTYREPPESYAGCRARLRDAMVDSFERHISVSGQQSQYVLSEAALQACPEVSEIQFVFDSRTRLELTPDNYGGNGTGRIFAPESPSSLSDLKVSRGK